jgi:magnesium chelatase subunit D
MSAAADPADDAAIAAALLAIDPTGLGGAVLRGRPGPARDRWLARLQGALPPDAPFRKLPAGVPDQRLLGGLDLAASLGAGRPIAERGLLAEADGGVLVAAMAERMEPGTAARLAAVLDSGVVAVARDGIAASLPARIGIVALDEGADTDERPPPALLDRLAFHLDADVPIVPGDTPDLAVARQNVERVAVPDAVLQALCGTALALGIDSPRAPLLALRAARAAAALFGRTAVSDADASLAARLVLAPRATMLPPGEPSAEDRPEPPADSPPDHDPGQAGETEPRPLDELVLEAARAAIPAGLLAALSLLAPGRRGASGRSGAQRKALNRGSRIGARAGELRGGARLDLLATLRAAAPWQRLRGGADGPRRVRVRREDFQIARFRQRAGGTAIFVVDASGSAAAARLAEAKGAVELLLADCYVRRDQVALIAFRGRGATLLLPPTGALARARRALAALPGGGGTPLAAGLDAALALADAVRRRGRSPLLVLLTDGRANVARDGTGGRPLAEADALHAARLLRAARIAALLIDTATRPQDFARQMADAMGARYLALPGADPNLLSRAVRGAAPRA